MSEFSMFDDPSEESLVTDAPRMRLALRKLEALANTLKAEGITSRFPDDFNQGIDAGLNIAGAYILTVMREDLS